MKMKVFGIGAGGNKAAIKLLEENIMNQKDVYLLNTTTKDIPNQFKTGDKSKMVIQFASLLGGCGKEPEKGKKAILNAIKNGQIDFGSLIENDTQEVVLVTTTGGGSGCGATPWIAKYFLAMNLPVHIYALIGFKDDAREISNTLNFFRNLDSDIILHTIKNEEFLDYTGNHHRAEEEANKEFAKQILVLKGSTMIPSEQNIDETDMYKISTTSGYMNIHFVSLANIRSQEQFNTIVKQEFDNPKCLEYTASSKRLAIIINATEKTQDVIDDKFEVIKRYTGVPFELFKHIQYNPQEEEYMNIIISGMDYPEDAFNKLNKEFVEKKNAVNTSTKSFNDIFGNIDLEESSDFDMGIRRINNPAQVNDIFSKLVGEKTAPNNVVTNLSDDDEY